MCTQACTQNESRFSKPYNHAGLKAYFVSKSSPQFPGHCLALDTIEFNRDGMRRCLLTLTDNGTEFAGQFASALQRQDGLGRTVTKVQYLLASYT